MNILVTAGATREPIDAVRFLSNVSTGATGAALAEALAARGHQVTLLCGEGAVRPETVREIDTFSSAADLSARLRLRLAGGAYDAVIMAAAVADYRPELMASGKLSSDAAERTLTLVRTEKILPQLRMFSPRSLRVVGFKLTVHADDRARYDAVAAQFASGGVDVVVHNDLAEIKATAVHPFWLYRAPGASPVKIEGVAALAEALIRNLPAGGPPAD